MFDFACECVCVCVCNFIFLFQYFALLLSVFKKQFQKDLINLGQAEWRFAGDFLEMWPRSQTLTLQATYLHLSGILSNGQSFSENIAWSTTVLVSKCPR